MFALRTTPRPLRLGKGMRAHSHLWPGVPLAVGSAVLFGLSAPVAKQLLESVDPQMLAALLYLGAGLGLVGLHVGRAALGLPAAEAPLRRPDLPWLAAVVLFAIAPGAPLLMFRLFRTQTAPPPPSSGSFGAADDGYRLDRLPRECRPALASRRRRDPLRCARPVVAGRRITARSRRGADRPPRSMGGRQKPGPPTFVGGPPAGPGGPKARGGAGPSAGGPGPRR